MKTHDYVFELANEANEILEKMRQRQKSGASPELVPNTPMRMCLAEVEAVLVALYHRDEWKPPE